MPIGRARSPAGIVVRCRLSCVRSRHFDRAPRRSTSARWRTRRSDLALIGHERQDRPFGGVLKLSSLGELIDALAAWLDHSDDSQLANTTYGGVGWLTVDTPLGTMTINADTRRDAIESLVEAGRSDTGLRMNVIANQRGRINKVTFDNCSVHGWYAYIDPPVSMPVSHPTT